MMERTGPFPFNVGNNTIPFSMEHSNPFHSQEIHDHISVSHFDFQMKTHYWKKIGLAPKVLVVQWTTLLLCDEEVHTEPNVLMENQTL